MNQEYNPGTAVESSPGFSTISVVLTTLRYSSQTHARRRIDPQQCPCYNGPAGAPDHVPSSLLRGELGVLGHSTHVRGSGVMADGVEKADVKVTLASKIPPEDCARLNLGCLDAATINPAGRQNREDEGILYVAKAGEKLYKVRS